MKKTMFNYTKSVLEKVSFDPELFCKELRKAIDILLPFEIEQLEKWFFEFVKLKPELQHCQVYLTQ